MASKIFARVVDDVVVETISEVEDIEQEWHADFLAMLVDVTAITPPVQVGWVRSGKTFSAPPPYEPPPNRQMIAEFAAGCAVVSTDTPTLTATYDAVGPRWQDMRDEMVFHIASFGTFSGDLTEIVWPAKSGPVTFSTTDQFKTVVRAIAGWQAGWKRYVDGQIEAPPTQPVTIP